MIKVHKITNNFYDSNSYIVVKQDEFIIIDPCVNASLLTDFFINKKCLGIFLTHGHYDHFCEIESFEFEKYFLYMHKEAVSKIYDLEKNYGKFFNAKKTLNIKKEKIKVIEEGKAKISKFEIEIIETPGHSSCCLCFKIEKSLFTGDTLFKESIGRTDLFSSNSKEMKKSLYRLTNLPKNLIVYPGHEENTTLANELINNVFIRKSDKR